MVGSNLDRDKVTELAAFYRKNLLDVMAVWEARTADCEHGGYLTCFDDNARLVDADKYIWMQGRQLWMFSALYNRVERRQGWLELARHGRDFIVAHAYAGHGRWHYQLDQTGRVVRKGTISIYSDHFVLAGLCEYALASGSDADADLIRETYDAIERHVHDPDFRDIFHGTWSPRYKRHGIHMISVNVAQVASQVLGTARTQPLIDHCLHEILYVFAKDEQHLLFESLGWDGAVIDESEGRLVNPGHALESIWFCLEVGRERNDPSLIRRAVEIADWTYQAGYDTEYGGLFAYLDASGCEPEQTDWHREAGMAWDDKVWWVHSEALYTSVLCAVLQDNSAWFGRFLDLHGWCQEHFVNRAHGEWYSELLRDGRPKTQTNSAIWKSAFHLPRALMMIALLLESAQVEAG